ncbi:MAG: tryptophan synthase subunit alpha [Dehalococcoidia bacterium]|nr:tryptophan synthase subunit alpha [Dehalococcoidia bacterium]
MTDRIAAMFERTRAEGRPAVIPFAPSGWPEPDATVEVVRAAVEGGADAFELGLPFSDPLADGPVNQLAYQQAIAAGTTTATVIETARRIRDAGIEVPLLVMGYINPLLSYGLDRFAHDAAEAGIDGLIIVDVPPHEATELEAPARAAGLHMVYLLAPTSTDERIRLAAEHGSGFLYCVSVTGVTGERQSVAEDLGPFLARVRALTDLPLAVGFGIRERAHVEAVGALAEGAVIGSAFVRTISESSPEQRPERIRAFMEEITGREPGPVPAVD